MESQLSLFALAPWTIFPHQQAKGQIFRQGSHGHRLLWIFSLPQHHMPHWIRPYVESLHSEEEILWDNSTTIGDCQPTTLCSSMLEERLQLGMSSLPAHSSEVVWKIKNGNKGDRPWRWSFFSSSATGTQNQPSLNTLTYYNSSLAFSMIHSLQIIQRDSLQSEANLNIPAQNFPICSISPDGFPLASLTYFFPYPEVPFLQLELAWHSLPQGLCTGHQPC